MKMFQCHILGNFFWKASLTLVVDSRVFKSVSKSIYHLYHHISDTCWFSDPIWRGTLLINYFGFYTAQHIVPNSQFIQGITFENKMLFLQFLAIPATIFSNSEQLCSNANVFFFTISQ